MNALPLYKVHYKLTWTTSVPYSGVACVVAENVVDALALAELVARERHRQMEPFGFVALRVAPVVLDGEDVLVDRSVHDDGDVLAAALVRLASVEAFAHAGTLRPVVDDELRQRINFARTTLANNGRDSETGKWR